MWKFDNAIFNVNGSGHDRLQKTLELVYGDDLITGYKMDVNKGMILFCCESGDFIKFPAPLNPAQVTEIIFAWLQSDAAKKIKCEGWDANADHDGDNELGWRVYTEDWGHINGDWNCVAVKPAYLWYGK